MVLFRGITTEGKVVEGSLVQFNGHNYIVTDKNGYSYSRITASHGYLSTDDALEVPPSSLAMSTGISDKNKVPIYGSFEVDGFMSEGGSEIVAVGCGIVGAPAYPIKKLPKLKVEWSKFGVWSTGPVDMDYAVEYEKNHPLGDQYTAGHFLYHFHSIEVIPKEQESNG